MKMYYPKNLPVTQHRDQIAETIRNNQVTIIAGETGSGKTTQLPKICLELLGSQKGIIGCTQPRRVAALTVAQRVAEEMGELGNLVGTKIRFQDRTSENTRVKFMTDGILLAETNNDKFLHKYSFLIIDEAHERSLNIDFLIGHLKNIIAKRKKLKVILTSATFDTSAFAQHFDSAPVIRVSGRSYPVEVHYRPLQTDEYGEYENYVEASVDTVQQVLSDKPPGDILIFMPTERDIRNCTDLLHKKVKNIAVLPLYGRLSPADQKKIFQPLKKTKVVVATNVAETSITVPGIRYVIDTGLARIAQYNYRSKTHSLPIRKVSQASCEQRKGRCGRIGPGVCIRLYEEDDFHNRDEYTLPEIKRANLAEVILQMLSHRIGDPYRFPFIDPPRSAAINEGFKSLHELGALKNKTSLSKIGKIMASLPIDPSISRIIIEANKRNCLREIMAIATVLAIQDPRIRPVGKEEQADAAHLEFVDKRSDFLTLLNIWNLFHRVKTKTSWSTIKKFCRNHYISFQRMREWLDLHQQMQKIILSHADFELNDKDAPYEAIHRTLLSGLFRNIGMKTAKNTYQGPAGKEVMIFPGSGLFNSTPQWIVASSFLETTRLFAINVAAIEAEWLEQAVGSLCRYSWSDPSYHKKTGRVVGKEKVTLFGLVIVPSRKVNFGHTSNANRQEARAIFIQSALVEGNLQGKYTFLRHNLELVRQWSDIESKLRVRNVVVSEQDLCEFYQQRLPDTVFDRSTLNRQLKINGDANLYMQEENLLNRKPEGQELADFPSSITLQGNSFPLDYIFDPLAENDGVSIMVPIELYETIDHDRFEWLVPGLLKEKVHFLLKSLPKKLRRHLIPLNHAVDRILDDISRSEGCLYKAISSSIFKHYRLSINRTDWTQEIPHHLQMNICLTDSNGKIITSSRDNRLLLHSIGQQRKKIDDEDRGAIVDSAEIKRWEKLSTRLWEFDNLPEKLPLLSKNGLLTGYLYPAITPQPDKAAVTVSFHPIAELAEKINRAGLRFLFRLQYQQQYKVLKKHIATSLSGPSSIWFAGSFAKKSDAIDKILDFIIDTMFSPDKKAMHSREEYLQKLQSVAKADFFQTGRQIHDIFMTILRKRHGIYQEINRYSQLDQKVNATSLKFKTDLLNELDALLPVNFLELYAFADFEDLQRYLGSLAIRITRAYSDTTKDARKAEQLAPFYQKKLEIEKRKEQLTDRCLSMLQHYNTMLNEFKVSLFSPELKTKFPVSAKKLTQYWAEISREC